MASTPASETAHEIISSCPPALPSSTEVSRESQPQTAAYADPFTDGATAPQQQRRREAGAPSPEVRPQPQAQPQAQADVPPAINFPVPEPVTHQGRQEPNIVAQTTETQPNITPLSEKDQFRKLIQILLLHEMVPLAEDKFREITERCGNILGSPRVHNAVFRFTVAEVRSRLPCPTLPYDGILEEFADAAIGIVLALFKERCAFAINQYKREMRRDMMREVEKVAEDVMHMSIRNARSKLVEKLTGYERVTPMPAWEKEMERREDEDAAAAAASALSIRSTPTNPGTPCLLHTNNTPTTTPVTAGTGAGGGEAYHLNVVLTPLRVTPTATPTPNTSRRVGPAATELSIEDLLSESLDSLEISRPEPEHTPRVPQTPRCAKPAGPARFVASSTPKSSASKNNKVRGCVADSPTTPTRGQRRHRGGGSGGVGSPTPRALVRSGKLGRHDVYSSPDKRGTGSPSPLKKSSSEDR